MERSCFLFLPLVTLLLLQCHMAGFALAQVLNITTDQSALLALKARISYDPREVLTANWSTSISVCSWVGVTCGSSHLRVVALNLSYMGLVGTIPPHIGNLSFLVSLSITNNSFSGSLPDQLSRLYRLQHLSFGFNQFSGEIPPWICLLVKLQALYLHGNKFIGSIPQSLNMSSLQKVDLSYNQLSGPIPSSILNQSNLQELYLGENRLSDSMPSIAFNMSSLRFIDLHSNKLLRGLPRDMFNYLPNLQYLDLSQNQFDGELPSGLFNCKQLQYLFLHNNNFTGSALLGIGNLTLLKELHLSNNNFEGAIPIEFGNLRNLETIDIGFNNFNGPIPFQIFNISMIQEIGMYYNHLSGNLPSDLGFFLPNLQILLLEGNRLSGSLPSSISNASQLTYLDLSENSFSGLIPKALANLRLLQCLNVISNDLTIESSTPEFNFFSLFSNLVHLQHLGLSFNPLNDILPSSIGNLSTSLQRLLISNCNMKGSIPNNIGNLSNLLLLELEFNEFSGSIPTAMSRLYNLQGFFLGNNRLEGSIPSDLCHLTRLFAMNLSGNELSGSIPACLNNLTSLRSLYLDSNKLTSMIPLSLWSLTYILNINLSSNFLNGSLPIEIANLKVLSKLDLSRNKLSSDIPLEIGSLKDIVYLSLANNRLEGSIPYSIGELRSLEFLDLSSNHLSGEIPLSLGALSFLKYINVSLNDGLCGATKLQVPLCKGVSPSQKTIVACTLRYVLPTIGLTMFIVALILTWTRWRKKNAKFQVKVDLSPLPPWRKISYQDLVQATEGFSLVNFLGEGSFGSVYKGKLTDGISVAIKVLNSKERAFMSFDVESKILSNICHRNLIKIISTCSNTDFKALILEYMPNGSLEKWLHSQNYYLDILQRLNTMIDVASALEYLHHEYSMTIVHLDLKPSNILLDEDMTAHVADFGIARLFDDVNSTEKTMTLATIGYMAPEYGSQGTISTKADVYSYGILLLETFTRKRPTDDMFVGGLSLKTWVEESLNLSVLAVVDRNLLEDERRDTVKEHCISSIMGLALSCCAESPEQRINMRSVVVALNKIKLKFLQDNQED